MIVSYDGTLEFFYQTGLWLVADYCECCNENSAEITSSVDNQRYCEFCYDDIFAHCDINGETILREDSVSYVRDIYNFRDNMYPSWAICRDDCDIIMIDFGLCEGNYTTPELLGECEDGDHALTAWLEVQNNWELGEDGIWKETEEFEDAA